MCSMSVHVAILLRPYIRMILAGVKTMESRLTRAALPPVGRLKPGERLYFKASGGPYLARARAAEVLEFRDLTPTGVDRLRRDHDAAVRGTPDYWRSKRNCRYATLARLSEVEPIAVGPSMPPSSGLAWFVLDEGADPVLDLPLSPGAVRNRYVRVPAAARGFFGAGEFDLGLPDGVEVRTAIDTRGMLRWRGWGAWFSAQGLLSIRFVRVAPGRFLAVVLPGRVGVKP